MPRKIFCHVPRPNRCSTFRTILVGFGFTTAIVVAGCQKPAGPPPAPKPPEVLVQCPTVEDVLDYEETTGRLVARESVEIRSRVSGYLEKTFFDDGAEVEKGDTLFLIDARPYDAELVRTSANVNQAEARLERLKRDEDRKRRLFETKNTTREEVELIASDRAEAEASLASLIASRELAKLDCKFTKIESPITGRISRRLVDPGNLVKADDTPLVTVMSMNPIYAYFDIDERTILKFERLIREGKIKSPRDPDFKYEVTFSLADEDDFSRKGSIDFLDNHISATTGTLRLRATVENERLQANIKNADWLLSPGMFIRLHVPIGTPHPALLVPEEALGSDQGQRFVYVLNQDDEVVYRPVKIGLLTKGKRVIEEGVNKDDRVIVSGLQRVRVGKKVTPKQPGTEPTEKPPEATPSAGK